MGRNVNIVEVNQADGLDPIACRKINENFRSLASLSDRSQASRSVVEDVADAVVPIVKRDLMADMYPVGSIIITMDANDGRLSYGSWRPVASGRFVIGADSGHPAGSEGGAESVMLRPSDLPPHRHSVSMPSETGKAGTGYAAPGIEVGTRTVDTSDYPPGDQTSVSIVPPYIAAYMYERYR